MQREAIDLMLGPEQKTSAEVARIKGIPRSTLKVWRKHFLLFGETPAESRQRKARLGPRQENPKMNIDTKRHFASIVEEHPYLYLDEYQAKLHQELGVWVHVSTLYKFMKKDLAYRTIW